MMVPFRARLEAVCYVALTAPFVLSLSANAEVFCDELQALTPVANVNFKGAKGNVQTPDTLTSADKCSMVQGLSGANAFHCSWKFGFRESAATEAFDRMNQKITACFPNSEQAVTDEGVNHPDSYQQFEYTSDKLRLSLSIKDKGALQETYVFLSVQAAPSD